MPDTVVKKVVTDDEIYRARLKRTLTESSVDKIDNEKGFIAFKALFTNKTREQLKSAGDRDLKSLRAEYNEYLKNAKNAKDQDERAGLLEAALGKINNKREEIDKKLFSRLDNPNHDPDVERYNDAIRKLNGRSQYVEQDYGTRYYQGAKRSYKMEGGKLIIEDLPVFGQREGKKWVYERKEGENALTVTRTDYSFEYLKQGGRDGDVLVDKQGRQILAARQIGEPSARKIILAPFKTVNAEGKPIFQPLPTLPGMTQEAKAKIATWNQALEKLGTGAEKTETVIDKDLTYKKDETSGKITVTKVTYDLTKPKIDGKYQPKETSEITLVPGKHGLEFTETQTIDGQKITEKDGIIRLDGKLIFKKVAYFIPFPGGRQLPVISDSPLSVDNLRNIYTTVAGAPPQLFSHLLTKDFKAGSPAIYVKQDLGELPDSDHDVAGLYIKPNIFVKQKYLESERDARFVFLHEGMHHTDHTDKGQRSTNPGSAFIRPSGNGSDKKWVFNATLKESDYVTRYAATNPIEDYAETGRVFLESMKSYLGSQDKTMADLPNLTFKEIEDYCKQYFSDNVTKKMLFIYQEVFWEGRKVR